MERWELVGDDLAEDGPLSKAAEIHGYSTETSAEYKHPY